MLIAPVFALPSEAQTNLTATPRNSEVVLTWDGSSTTKLFTVQRAASPDGPYETLVSNWSKSEHYDGTNSQPLYIYTDATAVNGTAYYCEVVGVGGTTAGPTSQMIPVAYMGWTGGWVPQHRPSAYGTFANEYDISGLTGKYSYSSGKVTNPTIYLGDYLGDTATFNLGMGKSLPHLLLNGTSTFTWKWILPVNPQGLQNDPNKGPSDPSQPFPIPPLYALAIVDPYADATPGTNTTMACTATIADGWGWSQSFTIPSSQTPQIPNTTNPRRKIVSVVLRNDNVNADVKLSPSVKVDINSTGTGKASAYLAEQADALTLRCPTPNVRPDLGDPNAPDNQFVYSSDANGLLTIYACMDFYDSKADTDWLTNQNLQSYQYPESLVDWQLDRSDVPAPRGGQPTRAAMERLPNHNEQTNVGQLTPYTVEYNSYYGLVGPSTFDTSTSQKTPSLVFNGLPLHNAGFGNHTVTLGIKSDPNMAQGVYSPSQTAYIQTFFPGLATNWPSSDGVTPNWYYYYNQVFPDGGTNNQYNVAYVASSGPSQADPSTNTIEIHNDAYTFAPSDGRYGATGVRVFDIDPNQSQYIDPVTQMPITTRFIRYIGTLYLSSMLGYIMAARHEQGHVDTYITPDGSTTLDGSSAGNIYTIDKGQYDQSSNPNTSHDGDNISDGWEASHHMNPTSDDTTMGASGYRSPSSQVGDGNIPDNQVLADIPALGAVVSSMPEWNQDWADGGLQYSTGTVTPYFISDPYPATSATAPPSHQPIYPDPAMMGQSPHYPPMFYLVFNPVVDGKTFKAKGIYKIRSGDELKAEYPDLLTSLQDLDKP